MAAVHDAGSSVAERVLQVARSAVEQDGADSIVLGCSCMTRLTEGLQSALDVPVIDPLLAGFAATQRAADAPREPLVVNQDTRDRIHAAVDVWAAMGDSTSTAWVDDCGDVCATVA